MKRAQAFLVAGLGGGLIDLGLETVAAFATLGFTVSLEPGFVAFYLAAGLVAAIPVAAIPLAASRVRRSRVRRSRVRRSRAAEILCVVVLLQGAAVLERVYHALAGHSMPWVGAGWTLAAAACVAWVGVLWWLMVRRPGGGSAPAVEGEPAGGHQDLAWALALGASTLAAGLAVNRNLVPDIVSRQALAADLAIAAGVAAVAWMLGRLRRRRGVVAVVLMALLVAITVWLHRPPAARKTSVSSAPNLVLVVIDTLRQDVFRRVVEETPEGTAFAAAAAGSAWFDNAIAAAPWTAPSVATIMTGLWPPEHGYGYQERVSRDIRLTGLTPEVRTLAEMLQARGYSTTALVANPVLGIGSGLERGFERFELLSGRTSQLPLLTVGNRLGLVRRELYLDAAGVRRRLASHLPSIAADARPAFLWLHLMDPHAPLHRHAELPPDPGARLRGPERLYREETRFVLAELGRMIEMMQTHDLWRNTVFVMVGDHGEMFTSDDRGALTPRKHKTHGHGHALYGELVRVPLVIRPVGGLSSGRRLDVLTSHVDVLATLGALLGLDLPLVGADRYSLAPWLGGFADPAPPRRRFALIGANHSGEPQQALRGVRHKLIRYHDPKRGTELFDVVSDPAEKVNLATEEPETTDEMARILEIAWGSLERAESEAVELDAETREQLRALGYLD